MPGSDEFISSCMALKGATGANVLYVVSRNPEFVKAMAKAAGGTRTVVLTQRDGPATELEEENVEVSEEEILLGDLDILNQLRYFFLRDCVTGVLKMDDKVLCILDGDVQAAIFFDVAKSDIVRLMANLEECVDLDIMERAMDLALEIVREGREGQPVGALFLLSDTDRVLEKCTPHIINPFAGHSSRVKNLHDKKNWGTIKQFALLDGACLIDSDGHVVAAGLYVKSQGMPAAEGTGGRHAAAAAATKGTRAVAILVSSTGTIEVYKDGKIIFDMKYGR